VAGKVIATGKSVLIPDFIAQTEIETIKIGSSKGSSKARARSVLAVPIRVGNEIMGAISVQSYQPAVYSNDDAVLLAMLASYTGVTIQNADLFEQTRYRAAQLVRINDLGRAMAGTFDLLEIYTRLARIALDLVPGSSTLYISLFNQLTQEIERLTPSTTGKCWTFPPCRPFICRRRAKAPKVRLSIPASLSSSMTLGPCIKKASSRLPGSAPQAHRLNPASTSPWWHTEK